MATPPPDTKPRLVIASGVTYLRGGEQLKARASREIIVSAGTMGSPAILMRSGIGPASVLAKHGIAIRYDLRGVGENLQEHAGVG